MKDEQLVEVDEKRVMMVVLSIAHVHFAMHGSVVKEILYRPSIFPVPGAPETVLGIINVRGDIESVIDINRLLGYPEAKPGKDNRVIIAEDGGIRTGVLVDAIEDVVDVPESAISPPLSTLDDMIRDFVTGEVLVGDRNITLLNAANIFRMACS